MDFPIKMVIFHSYVKLPESKPHLTGNLLFFSWELLQLAKKRLAKLQTILLRAPGGTLSEIVGQSSRDLNSKYLWHPLAGAYVS